MKLSRHEKRANKRRFWQEGNGEATQHPLDIIAEGLRQLQEEDGSLDLGQYTY